jgi:glycosyltransferase involved in cell wall biosynthesis
VIGRLQRVLSPVWNLPNRLKRFERPRFTPTKTLSVVIGSYNRYALLPQTIQSVRDNAQGLDCEIIVIDGGSTDGALKWLIQQKDIITIVQHNRGEVNGQPIERRSWGYFMNLGFKATQGKYVLMLSDDCLLLSGALQTGLDRFSALEKAGRKVGAMAFYFRNWPQEQAYYVQKTLGNKLFVNHGLYLRQAMADVGWVDEERYQFYKADGDLCLKMWHAGYEVVECPGAYVEHYYDADEAVRQSNNAVLDCDRKAYAERWQGIFYDPYHPQIGERIYQTYRDPEQIADHVWKTP